MLHHFFLTWAIEQVRTELNYAGAYLALANYTALQMQCFRCPLYIRYQSYSNSFSPK